MSTDRTIRLARLKTTGEKLIEVSVSYSKGGINYMTYKQEPRGYQLHVQPLKIEGNWVTIEGFTGVKQTVEEAKRFSRKKLEEVAARIDDSATYHELITYVCMKQGLQLAEEAEATA